MYPNNLMNSGFLCSYFICSWLIGREQTYHNLLLNFYCVENVSRGYGVSRFISSKRIKNNQKPYTKKQKNEQISGDDGCDKKYKVCNWIYQDKGQIKHVHCH